MFPFETLGAIVGPWLVVLYVVCGIAIWLFADSVLRAELPRATSDRARGELNQAILLLRVFALLGFIGAVITVACVFWGGRRVDAPKERAP